MTKSGDEFYLFKHFSHYVQPGSQKLAASEGDNHVAFKLADGRTMVMVYNNEEADKSVNIKVGDALLTANLKAKSINSIVVE